jgi:hypothetical protein
MENPFLLECVRHIQNRTANILSIISIAVLLVCSANVLQAQNQVITSFTYDDFQVNRRGSNYGYYYIGGNSHQLTNRNVSPLYQTTAIWYISAPTSPTPHSMLDLSKDFVFDCYFTFDSKIFFKKLNFIIIF